MSIQRRFDRPAPSLEVTTLWDFPSQNYGTGRQGDQRYRGATPSYVIWNLLSRYTQPGELVVDPMCGSGTTLDVARDLGRKAQGFDLQPTRPEIQQADARRLPMPDHKADFVFIDPPYADHLAYSDDPRCLGKLPAEGGEYFRAMEQVLEECGRVLRRGGHLGLYVSDSLAKHRRFVPLGFELFALLRRRLTPVDIVSVVRHNADLQKGNYRAAAERDNFFLRGFNYLFIMRKDEDARRSPPEPAKSERSERGRPSTPFPRKGGKPATSDGDRPPHRAKRHGRPDKKSR